MRNVDGATLYSASDLINFLGCAHATVRDLRQLTAPVALPPDDEQAVLLQEKGINSRARLPLRVHIKTNHTNGLWARESLSTSREAGPKLTQCIGSSARGRAGIWTKRHSKGTLWLIEKSASVFHGRHRLDYVPPQD